MSLFKLFIRFSLIYIIFLYIAGFTISYYGFESNNGINNVILICTIILVRDTFTKKNNRKFTQNEKMKVIIGFSSINIFIQLVSSLFSIWSDGLNIPIDDLFFAVIVIGIIHSIGIYFIISYEKDKDILKKIR